MAAPDASNVLVGTPDQAATGAIKSAPIGATAPTSAVDVDLDTNFPNGSGYVDDQGLQVAPNITTTKIREWSGAVVREILDEFDGTISWAHLETNEESLKNYFGDDKVTATAADATHGNQLAGKMGAYDLPRKAWIFKIKDGNTRVLIYVPNGQITRREAVSFNKGNPVKWGVTLTCYPDANGDAIHFFTDDGQITP